MEGIHGKHISIATLFIIFKASTTMESVQLSSFLISTILPRSTLPVRYFSKKKLFKNAIKCKTTFTIWVNREKGNSYLGRFRKVAVVCQYFTGFKPSYSFVNVLCLQGCKLQRISNGRRHLRAVNQVDHFHRFSWASQVFTNNNLWFNWSFSRFCHVGHCWKCWNR